MKVICAGFPKTGTKSLTKALRALGYSVYDFPEAILYQKNEWTDIFEGKCTSDIFKRMYENVDAVSDNPACIMWDHIFKEFPESKVILLTRDEDEWYQSFVKQFSKTPDLVAKGWLPNAASYNVFLRVFAPDWSYKLWKIVESSLEASVGFLANCHRENEMLARSGYRKHNIYVQHVCPKEQLLIYDVRDGWEPLCKFLGKPTPNEPFPHLNKNGEISKNHKKFENFETMIQTCLKEIKDRFRKGLILLFIFVAFSLFILW